MNVKPNCRPERICMRLRVMMVGGVQFQKYKVETSFKITQE